MKNSRACVITLFACSLGGSVFGVEHGTLDVVQLNNTNNNQDHASPAVNVTVMPGGTAGFGIRGHNKGDYEMRFTGVSADDPFLGVLLSSVAQNSRNNFSGGGRDGISYATSHVEIHAGGFYIPTHAAAGSIENTGSEYNVNVSGAWFPHAEGWLAAHAKNTANDGPLTQLYSSPAIRLGAEFVDGGDGTALVDLRSLRSHGVAATPENGVLLVAGGKNAPNVAMSRANDDGTFTISCMASGTAGEQTYKREGMVFVYIPTVAAGTGQVKALGRIRSDGGAELEGGDLTITKLGTGEWLLKIDGIAPGDGTLIVSPEGGIAPAEADPLPNHTNNYVTCEWSEAQEGWIVQSRNVPDSALEDGATPDEPMFSFVFLTTQAEVPAPGVMLTSPANGHLAQAGDTLTLAADVSLPPAATLEKVEFFLNGESAGTATSAPYELPWTADTPRGYVLEAFATTTGGVTSGAGRIYFSISAQVGAPEIPGYSAAILDGGDLETDLWTPEETPNWVALANTPEPLGFDSFGTQSGRPAVRIGGQTVPFDSGILLATNYAGDNFADASTRGSIDNNVIPFESDGYYAIKVDDNAQGGGNPEVRPESGRFAMGFFPFAKGWVGANVGADLGILGGSSNLPAGVTITRPGTGEYQITGLPMDGNLIAVSVGEDSDNIMSIGQIGDRWRIINRDNNETVEDGDFGFLYVPRQARQVLSGKVANDGTLTPLNVELEAVGATVVALGSGYEITFGDGSAVNPSTAALFVLGDINLGNGSDNIYSYHAVGNKFVVFSHDLPGIGGTFQAGGFRFLAVPFAPGSSTGTEVAVAATTALAEEGSADNTLVFRFTRLGDVSGELRIGYAVSGTATAGSDYENLSGTATFAAGESTVDVVVTVLPDMEFELDETVILTLTAGEGYTVGGGSTATGTIRNAASLVPVTTVSFQEGVGGYTGQFEKRIGDNGTNQLGSSVPAYYLDGQPSDAASPDINALMRFGGLFGNGPGQIPPNATVVKAELKLTTANGADSRSPGPYVVDRLVMPVNESTTYPDLDMGSGFEGARGASSGIPISAFGSLTNNSVETGDVTEIVRHWADQEDPNSANHGFAIFSAGTSDGWEYYTVGNADPALRPRLVVSYVVEETRSYEFLADQSARLVANAATEDGSTIGMSFLDYIDAGIGQPGTQEALFRFPVNFGTELGDIPPDEEIVRAELVVLTSGPIYGGSANAQSPGPIAVHRMLVDWDTAATFGHTGPVVGQDIDVAASRIRGMGQASVGYLDITGIVQAWRGGLPNYGLNLKPETTDGWQIFWPGNPDGGAPRLRVITAKLGTGGPTPFDEWAAANGIPGASHQSDAGDRDGIPAIVEYALGLNPLAFDRLPGLEIDGGEMTLRFEKGGEAAADSRVICKIQSSDNLRTWTDETAAVNNATEISLTLPVAAGGKRFYRLSVTYAP